MKALEDSALYEMCYEPTSESEIQKAENEKYKAESETYKAENEKYKVEIEKYKVENNDYNKKNCGLIELLNSYNAIFKLYIA